MLGQKNIKTAVDISKLAVDIICTICKTEIPTFLDSWFTVTRVKMSCPQE